MLGRVSTALCPHRPPCPGCPRYGEPGIAPAARAALDAFAARAGVAAPRVIDASGFASRHRARLMVRGRTRTPKIGLFQQGSHRIVDVPSCRIHHPLINRVAGAVRAAARDARLEPYVDLPHRGALRAIQIVVERRSTSAQLVLIENAAQPGAVAALAEPIQRALGDALHSLWWNGNPAHGNAILGPAWQHWSGPDAIVESVAGCEIVFPPGAFGQSQPALAEQIALDVQRRVRDGARVVEFHAGCGPLGMALLARAAHVAFNEVGEAALDGLTRGLARRPAAERARAAVYAGPASAHLDRIADADIAIVDPPRSGLEPELLAAIAAAPPPELLWVSCGLDRFLAQAAHLLERSPLKLRALTAYALFPFTEHVETLAHFSLSP
jgi:tRNA/tmRNA/rRNA uracil-C5-methylase (TrmA/RlmC/RlmD family)